MKKIKLALAIVALSFSTNASAMPDQVSDSWYGNMLFRLGVMSSNPGFCRGVPQSWICWS